MRWLRVAVLGCVVVLVTTACGAASPSSAPAASASIVPTSSGASATSPLGTQPVSPASPGTSASGNPLGDVVLPTAEEATFKAAAEAEIGVRRQLRDDIGVAAVIGPAGQDLIDFTEQSEQAFGEKQAPEFVQQNSIDLSADRGSLLLAAIGPVGPPAPAAYDEWSGSMIGLTSFMVATWLGFAPQGLQNLASRDTFETQNADRTETYDKSIDGVHEHLVVTEKVTIGAGQGRLVFDVVMTSASVMTNDSTGSEIARRISTDTGHFEVNACPDADGVGEGTYKIIDQDEITPAGGTANGGASSTEATFRVFNGDDAHLIRTEVDANLAAGAHGSHPGADGSAGEPFDWGAQAPFTITIPASGGSSYSAAGPLTAHDATDENTHALSAMLAMADHYLSQAAKAAESFWRSGQCIEVKPDEDSRAVTPNEQVHITVTAEHKWDKLPVPSPIKAAFTGVASVSPADTEVTPPAEFTFTAGPNTNDKGTIKFTQTGKRGIGEKTVEFTVGAGSYEGSFGGKHLAGSLHYCGSQPHPYWALDYGAPYGFVAYDIPVGSTDPVPAEIVNGDPRWTPLMAGTGQFVPGTPPHFIVVNGDGTHDVELHDYTGCPPPRPSP